MDIGGKSNNNGEDDNDDNDDDEQDRDRVSSYKLELVLRKWFAIDPSREMRAFVREGVLIGAFVRSFRFVSSRALRVTHLFFFFLLLLFCEKKKQVYRSVIRTITSF